MAAAQAKQLFLLHRNYKAEAAELCQFLEEAGCCAGEVLQVFDAGRGPERDVCLLGEVVERAVGVAQDDKGCVIPDLSDSQEEQMQEALCAVKEVIDGSCLDQLQIRTILVKHASRLPLEALWMLHQQGTLRLDHLLTDSAPGCSPHLVDALVKSTRAGQSGRTVGVVQSGRTVGVVQSGRTVGVVQSGRTVGVVQSVVKEIVQLGYDSGRDQESRKVAQEVLLEAVQRSFADGSWETAGEDGGEESAEAGEQPERFSLLDAIRSGDNCHANVFVEDLLGAVFQQKSASLTEVVTAQCSCVHSSLPQGRRTMLSQAALILPLETSLQLIWTHLKRKQPPWRGVLDYLSCLLHAVPQTGQQTAALLRCHADKALQSCDTQMLQCVLIVARQASLEGPHIFQPYHQWFKSLFGNSPKTLVSTKKQLMCLVQTLTELVPNEPTAHLKAHLRSPPRGLAKCHEAIHSYLSAVRARLKELNESVDLTDSPSGGRGGEHQSKAAQGDMLAALMQYRTTGRVPQSVMQASLFKKPYYVGRFLPALLTGSVEDTELQVTRQQLISELRRAGKVPLRLLEEYDRQTAAAATGDTDMDHSSPMADVLLRDVKAALRQVSTAVGREEHRRVSAALSKFSAVLSQSSHQLGPCLEVVTLAAPGLRPLPLQLVDLLLTSVCETVAAHAVASTEPRAGEGVSSWVGQLLQVFVGVTHLVAPLVVRVWDLLSNKLGELSDSHLCGLAVLCVHLVTINSWREVKLIQRWRCGWWANQTHPLANSEILLKSGEECVVFLINGLASRTLEESVRSLRFLHVLLHFLSPGSPGDSPPGPPGDSPPGPALTAALQWFTCLRRRVAQLESAAHCGDGGPPKKRLKTEVAQLLSDCSRLEAGEPLRTALQAAHLVPLTAWLDSELDFTLDEQHGTLLQSGYLLNTALESYLTAPLSAGGFEGDLRLLFCEVFASLAHLCVTNRVGVEGYQCGLALLQSLAQAVIAGQPTDPLSTRPPVLVAAMRRTMSVICASEGEESGTNRAAIQSFKAVLFKSCLQVCSHLPPHLVVIDAAAAVGQTDVSALAEVLLADYACLLYEHRLLPLSIVYLVIQGFLSALHVSCDKTGVASLFEQLVMHAPLFFGSLCFWRDSLPRSWHGDLSIVVRSLGDKMAAVLELVAGTTIDSGKGLLPALSSDDSVLCTAVVCAFARLVSTSSHSEVQGLLHRLLKLTTGLPPQHDKVCTTMLDLVLSCLDGLVLTEGGDNKPHPLLRVAAICLERCPSAAITVCQDTPPEESLRGAQLQECLGDFRKSYPVDSSAAFARPLTFFWVVRNMPEQSLVQLCQHSCMAAVARRMHDSCLALQSDPSIARLARETDRCLLQPFSVEFLQLISSIVRRALPS